MFEGHKIESRDVAQAYLQAKMEGPPVYIMLPKELWIPAMHEMRCPVFRLERTLYGHKHSGVCWNKFCHAQCIKAGFITKFGENLPGTYWHPEKRLLLIVYVDDKKLSGPAVEIKQAWEDLGAHINLKPQKGDADDVSTFLGCET
jgi:hypothetical protein